MGLAKTVTRMWPDENYRGINLVVTDDDRPDLGPGEQMVIKRKISRQYVSGEDMTNEIRDEIGNEAQKLIDDYKSLREKYDNPTYGTKVSQIDGALNL